MAEVSPLQPPAGGPGAVPVDPRAGLCGIAFEFAGAWTESLRSAFLLAAERIEAVVLGGLPDVAIPSAYRPLLAVDDLLIRAELPAMDGPDGVLGQAGITLLRADSLLPITVPMRLDAVKPLRTAPGNAGAAE